MKIIKYILGLFLVLYLILTVYQFFFAGVHYKIATPIRKNLFSLKTQNISIFSNLKSFVQKQTNRFSNSGSGFCAPPGCGDPDSGQSYQREDVTLYLSAQQITSLVNQYKPAAILFSNTKVDFWEGKIFASATSLYPFMPGNVSSAIRLYLNHFYIDDVFIGETKAPDNIADLIEANGNKIIDDLFQKYGVWKKGLDLVGDKLVFRATVPKGTIITNQDGTISLNLQEVKNNVGNAPNDPNVRF